MKRKYFILIIIMAYILSFTGCSGKNKKKLDLPNVVVIVIDTLRADHLPFYGYKEETTPFLSSLAKKSVLFENAFSTSSWTAPATASIFTSMYPFQHRVVMNMLATLQFNSRQKKDFKIKLNKIPEGITTIGEVFKEQGYATYCVSDNVNIGKKEGFDQGFDRIETYNYKTADVINKKIIEWKNEIKKNEKYFLYIQYMDVHQPNKKRAHWFKNRKLKDNEGKDINDVDVEIKKFNQKLYYDSELNYLDKKIEELFDLFKWDKNTLVIITSDHGEEFWDHGDWGHGYYLYKEVIHVPLFFYYPQGNFKINRIKQNVSLIDILPTLRDFIKLPKDKYNEGISLLRLLFEGEQRTINNRVLFSHLLKRRKTEKGVKNAEAYSVIYNQWHFIKSLPGKRGKNAQYLFNLIEDFTEQNDILSKNIKMGKKLKKLFFKFFKKCKKFKANISDYKSNQKEMDRLKTLGYVE